MHKVATFFTGIGGLDLAFVMAGFDIHFQCEIDDYCRQLLKVRRPAFWPRSIIKKDVRHVTKKHIGQVDVIIGGFPCQDISIGGNRAGIKRGNRSGLWFELERIIGEVRPRAVFLENVDKITASIQRDGYREPAALGWVLAGLSRLGYDAQWYTVRAADVDAPHRRSRWFCVAYPMRQRYRQQAAASPNAHHKKRNAKAHYKGRKQKPGAAKSNRQNVGYASRQRGKGHHKPEEKQEIGKRCDVRRGQYKRQIKPGVGRIAYGLSYRMDRHKRVKRADYHAGRWPAGMGEYQHDYEPPRQIEGHKHRRERVTALGNAVVPQQALPFALAIKELLNSQRL